MLRLSLVVMLLVLSPNARAEIDDVKCDDQAVNSILNGDSTLAARLVGRWEGAVQVQRRLARMIPVMNPITLLSGNSALKLVSKEIQAEKEALFPCVQAEIELRSWGPRTVKR